MRLDGKAPDIFMAYASEDEEISDFLKYRLEDPFQHKLSVFVASSNDGLTPGRVWFLELTQKLRAAKLVLAMVSRSALGTAWIPFECGTAYGAERTFIPLCHSGMRTDDLPQPFRHFQALNLVEERHLSKLFSVVKREINLPDPVTDIASMVEYFEEADRAADAWRTFNQLIVPIYWNDSIGFETLARTGAADLLVAERYVDQLVFINAFCKLRGIMSMKPTESTNSAGRRVVAATRGQKFSLLLSRRSAIADELQRITRSA